MARQIVAKKGKKNLSYGELEELGLKCMKFSCYQPATEMEDIKTRQGRYRVYVCKEHCTYGQEEG